MTILEDGIYTARKDYIDEGYYVILDLGIMNDGIFTISELREIVKIKRQKGLILKGQKYRRLVYKDGGKLITFRESEIVMNVRHKYDLYEEW